MSNFKDLNLKIELLETLKELGYSEPTPIQKKSIPFAINGNDILGIAQTGTGKTACFTLPLISLLSSGRAKARMPRSLILCPTRELASQVANSFEKYSKKTRLSQALLIGGVSFKDQDKVIDRGVDVLIATPGRLIDHFERGKLMLNGVQILVIDEADKMLDMGFFPDIEKIFKNTPFTKQTLFFSATMAPEIERITKEFLHNPKTIEIKKRASASENINQSVIFLKKSLRINSNGEKRSILRKILKSVDKKLQNCIIFCNRKKEVEILTNSLNKYGFISKSIHGDLDQFTRSKIINDFREGTLRLLVASDVAARGLDIENVSHVINFDIPTHAEDYVHRIGRTGRAGRAGEAISICAHNEKRYLDKIEELVKKKILIHNFISEKSKRTENSSEISSKDTSNPLNDNFEEKNKVNNIIGLGKHIPKFLLKDIQIDFQKIDK